MYRTFKRFFDILISGLFLLLLSPILIIITGLLPFFGEGEIFYRQKRVGYRNRPFMILKYATMLKNSEKIGTGSLTVRNDPRVTSIGKYLRMTKINELPQLLNVLKGDMSIVGPRPLMEVDFNRYPPSVRERVYNVKPGLTGIGSVIFRDEQLILSNSDRPPAETYEKQIMPYKGALELWYQAHAGPVTDLKILFLTGWCILNPGSKLPMQTFRDLPARTL